MQQQHIMGDINDSLVTEQTEAESEPGMTLSSEAVLAAENHLSALSKPAPGVVRSPQKEFVSTEADASIIDGAVVQEASVKMPLNEKVSASLKAKPKPTVKNKEWELVLALIMLTAEEKGFKGNDISAALNFADMVPGEIAIFHRYSPGQHVQTLFSVANFPAPGTLKPSWLPTLQTQGLVIFKRLSSPANGLLAFDAMLDAAEKIAKRLNGQLRDEHRQILAEATLEKMRSRILNFNLTQQLDNHQFKHDYSN
jgi:cell division protein ZipA